ncbi:MAG: C69 family dipeptidase [Planctomycetota bacterium]
MLSRYLTSAILLALLSPAPRVWACYAVIVGREASADGSVLVGHNEQNGGRRILNFRRIPRRQFAEGASVGLRRGGRLEQVPETWAFLWSENPGLEFSDAYLNEWGVGIVSDRCATREDDYQTLVGRGEIRSGGIGYMLRRLVAERARNAREGAELAGKLVERFGYVDTGRSHVIADPREAWVVAVVR